MKRYIEMPELAEIMGVQYKSLLNSISNGTFQIPTYKIGKRRVADPQVVETFFQQRRDRGLRELTT